jgi:hypothetical protein
MVFQKKKGLIVLLILLVILSGCKGQIEKEDSNKISSIYVVGGVNIKGDEVTSIVIHVMPQDENKKLLVYTSEVSVIVELTNYKNESIFLKQFKTNKWGLPLLADPPTINILIDEIGETYSKMITAKIIVTLPTGKNITGIGENIITTAYKSTT